MVAGLPTFMIAINEKSIESLRRTYDFNHMEESFLVMKNANDLSIRLKKITSSKAVLDKHVKVQEKILERNVTYYNRTHQTIVEIDKIINS